ncbi:hypothetical protein NUH88_20275 [Nisaea acidiphila]|uniref:Uncharacterized protein n=1 Tax=Nisaea acidiphila TaxID=1862145 RepID=A0A9J7AS76_9PROT|nr:hypothetical protein [Nisaea acidiphila]UUX49722.1 hypothetical protein NUH88_20275 [Nisaea acidiphila]
MEQIHGIIDNYYIAEWASISGLVISFFGFAVTIVNVVRSRDAATRAEEAAERAIRAITGIEIVDGLADAIRLLDEIQRLNRLREWALVLDRHSAFRNIVADLKANESIRKYENIGRLQSAFQHSCTMSDTIELFLEGSGTAQSVNVAQMNKVLSKEAEHLGALMVEIRTAVGAKQ